MDDNRDIAFLAASLEREMRGSLQGSSGLRYNRTDFRQFLNQQPGGGQPPPHFSPQQYHQQQYPPQQGYMPQQNFNNAPVDFVVPEGTLPPSQASLVPLPASYAAQVNQNQGAIPPQQLVERTDSFLMPDYSGKQKQYLEDEQEFRDALIKEIKSQKKSINKLNKEVESLIVLLRELKETIIPQKTTIETTNPEPCNDTTDQS